ncbi:hypothetical protein QBC33DRAFT_349637 [Phialemonium atrogriseum]|uniref:Uncharacterized protein n=1 Tax=Phialemonium atrogriseum TaxID=1093897 RepID=A0AAJ0C3H8_9PEZI|nr:uncharacterized protein QBC33DRAFT_349637 [Phialemonium atrogriseum]KAK1769270.1 hypothetical protein QBC33DRAFT_349637 [Phialemonium atrogriseum]
MQRLGSPWLIQGLLSRLESQGQVRTLIYKSPSQIEKTRRFRRRQQARSPRRETVPLYEIPSSLLDLDAEDNPRVRAYTEQDEKDQFERWSQNPKVDALSGRIETFRQELGRSERLWNAPPGPFNQRRISDRDVLSVAFLGALSGGRDAAVDIGSPDKKVGQVPLGSTSEILGSNGIPQRILEDDAKTVNFMLHWQERHEPQRINSGELANLKAELSRQSFVHLRRVAAQLLQTDAGSRMLSLCGAEVAFALADTAQLRHGVQLRDGNDPTEVLVFLSNVAIGLSARDINLPAPLRGLGLRLASKLFCLPAITNFLGLDQQTGLDGETGRLDANAVHEALRSILDHMHSQQAGPDGGPLEMRSEVFSLLTGRGTSKDEVKPSVRAMISDSNDFREAYKAYILLLGELGAARSLWHEWQGSTGFKTPKIDMNLILFTNATLRSVSLMRQQEQPVGADAVGLATGDYVQDVHLDRQLVDMLQSPGTQAGFGGFARPFNLPSQGRDETSSGSSRGAEPRAEVQQFLKKKQDITSALAALKPALETAISR